MNTPLHDIDFALLKSREMFLTGEISYHVSEIFCRELLILNQVSHSPILLRINCPGGAVSAGIAIIDAIKMSPAPIWTLIQGMAGSMGALISICGERRFITKNSFWMFHDLSVYLDGEKEYGDKIITRCKDYYSNLQVFVTKHLREYTKLTDTQIKKAKNQELWLFAEECKKSGIVDGYFKIVDH